MRVETEPFRQIASNELLPEERRIAEFQQTLARVGLTELTYTRVDTGQADPAFAAQKSFFAGPDFKGEPTFYLNSDVAHEFTSDIVDFEPFVSRGKGSAHQVFFGALMLADGSEVHVAIKPYESDPTDPSQRYAAEENCFRDYFTNVAAKDCGFESLESVGFILDQEGYPYSLTLLEESLSTLDSINWTRFYEQGYETVGMRELIHKVALLTAWLHSNGDSFHGDLALRNVATNPHGHVFFIDWEKGKVTNLPSGDVEERFGKSWLDLKTFLADIAKPTKCENPGAGLFTLCEEDWWTAFKDIFLDDYVEYRKRFVQQGSHRTQRMRDTADELAQLENDLHKEMLRWQAAAQA